MEVYIDDIVVELARAGNNFQHLNETFEILRKYNMKLIPEKCAFGVASAQYHHVANGQVESTNIIIVNNIKKQLEESKGRWPEVLPGVPWAYRTMTKISTGETPFSLVYGTEALIPVEIGEPSIRFEHKNEEELRTNLDLTEERRIATLI
ncbi:uncharacterized protein [Nicotiana tomentosiformis]|uniref:uncharacterized protein n=1 Tax=Nicotiana tomentosiformis TaxID=4098 RepID=UPI00388CC64B